MENSTQQQGAAILQAAFKAWNAATELRTSRRRNKRFTYGDQWADVLVTPYGRVMTEKERYYDDGTYPITNNLICQLVKTIVGRFRSQYVHDEKVDKALADVYDANQLAELDSRALEEFLISGCCVQRVDSVAGLTATTVSVENVNLNSFFVNTFSDPLGRDCEIVGQLHDLSVAQLVKRVAQGSRRKAAWVRQLYSESADARVDELAAALGADSQSALDFWRASTPGKCRAIEVWTLESQEVIVAHDRDTAQLTVHPLGALRRLKRDKDATLRWDVATTWHCRWFSPMGDELAHYESPYAHALHPFAIKFYPLTDGEVHSLVEDVIDQQKYVNRLISLIDHIMRSSAKGVLLFPQNALPDNFTWADMRMVWSRCNGILPYVPTFNGEKPEQISVNGTNIGAYEMVQLQMKLLEEISGVSGALQGKSDARGNSASLYQSETENSVIALTDIFDTFNAFRRTRDRLILHLGQ